MRRGLTPVRATALLLAGAVGLALAVELGTRLFIYDMSNMLGRLKRESTMAAALVPAADRPRPVLVVGNSLLIAAVDVARLDAQLRAEERSAFRFGIEQTTYFDWYYGLRRLVAGGARPDTIVLCFETRHLLGSGVHGDIFAHFLMRPTDLFSVAHALDLSPTEAADLSMANLSAFWGLRKEIRKNLLGRLLPGLPSLAAMMARGQPAPPPKADDLRTLGRDRLLALADVVKPAGIKFVLALAPPLRAEDAVLMKRLSEETGVPLVAPLTDDDLVRTDYDVDGYHLGDAGRAKYTDALGDTLSGLLRRMDGPAALSGTR